MEDFVITQISWLTDVKGNEDFRDRFFKMHINFANFLQSNGLTTRLLFRDSAEVTDKFAIRKSDLTEEGFRLVKMAYDKWVRKLDKGGDPDDLSILERALKKLRM